MKYSKKYLRGFREGFNNPSQHTTNILSDKSESPMILGIIAGYCKRMQNNQESKTYFLLSDQDVLNEIN